MSSLDAALSALVTFGPEYGPALSSHVPMAAEALERLGHPEVLGPYVEAWLPKLRPFTPARDGGIAEYPAALERAESSVRTRGPAGALEHGLGAFVPGLHGAAFHGLLRVGHAARAVFRHDTGPRRRELACALAYAEVRAAPELPATVKLTTAHATFEEALVDARPTPHAAVARRGIITPDLLARIGDGEELRAACERATLPPEPAAAADAVLRAALRLYVASDHDPSADFVLLHGVTAAETTRALCPWVGAGAGALVRSMATAIVALRVAYVPRVGAFLPSAAPLDEALVARAVGTLDDHAIKLAAACVEGQAAAPGLPWGDALARAIAAARA